MTFKSIMAALVAGVAMVPAIAQDPGSRETREFVQAAGESDTFEIMESQTALAQSSDPQVLAFAHRMIDDHGETSRRLSAATQAAGLKPPPMNVGAGQAPLLAALQSLRGHAFDDAYWRHQALAHRSALVVQQKYAAAGDVPAIREAAIAAVPLIQAHLAMAEQMIAKSNAGS